MGFNRVARRYYNTVKHAGLNRLAVLLLLLPSPSNSWHRQTQFQSRFKI